MKFLLVLVVAVAAVNASRPKLDGRIVGGKEVDIADYPYQASVRIYDQHICGGSIINPTTILTAGHCVDGMDHSQYSVRVGNTAHASGQRHVVSEVIENSQFNPNTLSNDVAILKLATPLQYTSTIQPIDLTSSEVSAGTDAWVSGWGVTSEGSQNVPSRLRAVDVSTITRTECNNKYGGGITTSMICAQTLGHDSCQGDSGGPLVANGKLIGVVSWGYGCARPQYPGVYANVANLRSWITNNM